MLKMTSHMFKMIHCMLNMHVLTTSHQVATLPRQAPSAATTNFVPDPI